GTARWSWLNMSPTLLAGMDSSTCVRAARSDAAGATPLPRFLSAVDPTGPPAPAQVPPPLTVPLARITKLVVRGPLQSVTTTLYFLFAGTVNVNDVGGAFEQSNVEPYCWTPVAVFLTRIVCIPSASPTAHRSMGAPPPLVPGVQLSVVGL